MHSQLHKCDITYVGNEKWHLLLNCKKNVLPQQIMRLDSFPPAIPILQSPYFLLTTLVPMSHQILSFLTVQYKSKAM